MARTIGNGFSSRRNGSSDNPNASSVIAPKRLLSAFSPKITSAPPTRSPYLNRAIPFFLTTVVPFASRKVSLTSGLMPRRLRTGVGTTEYTAPESTRNSSFSVIAGFAGFPTSIFRFVRPMRPPFQLLPTSVSYALTRSFRTSANFARTPSKHSPIGARAQRINHLLRRVTDEENRRMLRPKLQRLAVKLVPIFAVKQNFAADDLQALCKLRILEQDPLRVKPLVDLLQRHHFTHGKTLSSSRGLTLPPP